MLIERPPGWFRLLFPGAIFRMPVEQKGKKKVYLTFDDGPVPEVTPWVIDTLDDFGVKATFFMVGQNVERYPYLLKEIRNRGHSVGNHTLHHIKGIGVKTRDYLKDIESGAVLTGSNLFRPPHGFLSPFQFHALRKRPYTIIMYDLVTRDYSRRLTSGQVVENVKKYVRDGSVIVFHDSLKSLPRLKEALPKALEWLLAEGYCFGLIPDMKK